MGSNADIGSGADGPAEPRPWWRRALRIALLAAAVFALARGYVFIATSRTPSPSGEPFRRLQTLEPGESRNGENDAWPEMRRHVGALAKAEQEFEEGFSVLLERRDERVEAALAEHANSLRGLAEAVRRERLGVALGTDDAAPLAHPDGPPIPHDRVDPPDAVALLSLPHLSPARASGRALAAWTITAARNGDGATVTMGLEALANLARVMWRGPMVLDQAVAASIASLGLSTCESVLRDYSHVLSDAELVRIADAFLRIGGGKSIRPDFRGERCAVDDTIERCFGPDDLFGGWLTHDGVTYLDRIHARYQRPPTPTTRRRGIRLALAESRANAETRTAEYFDFLDRMAETEPWLRPAGWEAKALDMAKPRPRDSFAPVSWVLPVADFTTAMDHMSVRRDGLVVTIAIERARRQRGTWPHARSDVDPFLVAPWPLDVADGKPLRVRFGEGAPVLYSVGADRVDDDGRAARPGHDDARFEAFTGGPGDVRLSPW